MNKKYLLMLLVPVLSLLACTKQGSELPEGLFFGLEPTDTPQLLLPDFINSPQVEFNGTFTPDGRVFCFTGDIPRQGMIICTTMQEDGQWRAPAITPFSGRFSDYDPIFSPDGQGLYFSSRRPVSGEEKGSNVWYVERIGEGWSDPAHVPLEGLNAYYNSVTQEGTLYFNVPNTAKMYQRRLINGEPEIEELPAPLNQMDRQADPFMAPDGSYLIFRGYGAESLGRADLFISFNRQGTWTRPMNLGRPINSEAQEVCPWVSPDGRWFVFASDRLTEAYSVAPSASVTPIREQFKTFNNGNQNIYFMSADFINELQKSALVSEPIN